MKANIVGLTVFTFLFQAYGDQYMEDQDFDITIRFKDGFCGAEDLAVDSEGNVFISGYLRSYDNQTSAFIKRINPDGTGVRDFNLSIPKYGGTTISSIFISDNNELITMGSYSKGSEGQMTFPLWLSSTDLNSNTKNWEQEYQLNNSMHFPPQRRSILVTDQGDIFLSTTGNSIWSDEKQDTDWVIKNISREGQENTRFWNKSVDSGRGIDWPISIISDGNNKLYVCGIGNYDWWIKKYDMTTGSEDPGWDKTFDGSDGWDWAYAMAIDQEGNLYVGGFASNLINDTSGYDGLIKKFSLDGIEDSEFWSKATGQVDSSTEDYSRYEDTIQALEINSMGNLLASGYCTDENGEYGIILSYSPQGELLQKIVISDDDTGTNIGVVDMILGPDDTLYVAGYKNNYDLGESVGYVKKYVLERDL